jgi:copper chaperone CopZ
MKTVTYTIPNISCRHCTHTIAMELSEIQGVSKVETDVQTQLVKITFDDPATEEKLIETLAEINYPVAS